jgi:hypothetical protein
MLSHKSGHRGVSPLFVDPERGRPLDAIPDRRRVELVGSWLLGHVATDSALFPALLVKIGSE